MKKTKKGFTLVELLVVIAILAILATVAVVGYASFVDKAEDAKAQAELSQIVQYIDLEFLEDGEWIVGNITVTRNAEGQISVSSGTLEAVIKAHFSDLFTGNDAASLSVNGKVLTYTTAKGGEANATLR